MIRTATDTITKRTAAIDPLMIVALLLFPAALIFGESVVGAIMSVYSYLVIHWADFML
jgi:hypothetical protein